MDKVKSKETLEILNVCNKVEGIPASAKSKGQRKAVLGVGENDVDFRISYTDKDGSKKIHPAYSCWRSMLRRCYCEIYQKQKPTYKGCTVDSKWFKFSNFLMWWKDNYIFGYHLDKDLLFKNNTVYSEGTCIFVPPWLNAFTTDRRAGRGDCKIWVSLHINSSGNISYYAQGSKVFGCKTTGYLGSFPTEDEAYQCWLTNKLNNLDKVKDSLDKIDIRLYQNIFEIIIQKE